MVERIPDEDLPQWLDLTDRAFPPLIEPFTLSDLSIRTKERAIVRFEPNPVQRAYLGTLLPQWEETGAAFGLTHQRDILLKARQFGMSTLILALMFLDTVNTPNTQTVVIAHDAESTETLFRMVHRFYDHLPADRRPKKKYSSKRELAFSENGSYFSVATAGAGDYGRGGTINNVHGSEVSSWPDAELLLSGLMETVPDSGNVFLETTAKGIANWFHDEYQSAKRGDSNYRPRFYGWNLHPEYRRVAEPDFQRTDEEKSLVLRYGLDNEQLEWRRWKRKTLKKLFEQEYPLSDQEAFLTSSGRVLDRFIPSLAPAGHLCPAFIPPKHWRHYLVIDPGWRKLAALFAAVDPEGRVWLYGEHYEGGRLPREHLAILDAWRRFYGRPDYTCLMDPAGFTLRRTDTGHEHPSWADEFTEAAYELGVEWFAPSPADNSDPHALRVNRYFDCDLLRVCENLTNWQWEQQRWVWQEPGTGQSQQNRRDPDKPIDRYNHLCDCLRYLANLLPSPEPIDPPHRNVYQQHWDDVRREHEEAEREAKRGDVY